MATIALVMLPECGHLNPTFRLARSLQCRGHKVIYLAVPDLVAYIAAQSLDGSPLLEDVFPRGSMDPRRPRIDSEAFTMAAVRLAEGGVAEALLRRLQVDLVLVDLFLGPMALAAYRAGIPAATLSTTLPPQWTPDAPPLTSAVLPGRTPLARLAAAAAWQMVYLRRRLRRAREGYLPSHDWAAPLADWAGYPARRIDHRGVFRPDLTALPELVLCPRDFDVPRDLPDHIHYVDTGVDFERVDPVDFPWGRLDPGRALVYCALGTQSFLHPRHRARVLGSVVAAARSRPRWQLVMATGGDVDPEDLGPPPAGALFAPKVPQLGVLARASVMITHGGLNSIKECISLGVPMVAIPSFADQPGNAARVVFHGLGLGCDPRRVTPRAIVARVDRLLADAACKGRVRRLGERFKAIDAAQPGAELVGRLLARARPP